MKLQLKRLYSQFLFFLSANLGALGIKSGFCYPFFYCNACPAADAACPLRAIEVGVFKGNFNLKLIVYPFLILGIAGVITGRAFCGWACPIGLLQRGTEHSAKKVKKKRWLPSLEESEHEHQLRYIKYLILLIFVVITPILIEFTFTDICPVGILTGTIPTLILNPGKYVPSSYFFPAMFIFTLFIILILTIRRGWCRYFCPIGAIFALFNKISILHVEVDKEKCIHCNVCSKVCPMGINVPEMHRDPECILCGKCISICPQNIISYERR
jgi:ferredoxin-type protein NapH